MTYRSLVSPPAKYVLGIYLSLSYLEGRYTSQLSHLTGPYMKFYIHKTTWVLNLH